MTVESWLSAAVADAVRRGLPDLEPVLQALADQTRALREADFPAAVELVSPPPAAPRIIKTPSPGSTASQRLSSRSPIHDLARRLRAREISATEIVEESLRREKQFRHLNAFIVVMADRARKEAAEADRRLAAGEDLGLLHGIPVSVKDIFDVEGMPTTAASRVRENHVARADAATVVRLRAAGAIILGKTNLHEFALGTTNEDSAFGPVLNPDDQRRSPGGSSGGSAVSVATGVVFGSLGSDTGGSIRIPSAACGIVGIKPTFGEVPTEGLVPLAASLDHAGPLAATVTDAWLLLRALRGERAAAAPGARDPRSLRFTIPRPYFCDVLDDDVRERFEKALNAMRAAGVRIDEGAIAHAALTAPVYTHLSFPEAAVSHAATLDTAAEQYTRPVRLRLEAARDVLAEDYVRALSGRAVLTREVDRLLACADALVLPTLPIPAPPLGADTVPIANAPHAVRALTLRLTQLFDVTGHPAITVPCGRTRGGLACGLQLVGTRMSTDELISAALAVEEVVRS